jgi:hypothetical protein
VDRVATLECVVLLVDRMAAMAREATAARVLAALLLVVTFAVALEPVRVVAVRIASGTAAL